MPREVRPNHTPAKTAPGRVAPAASRRNDRNNNPAFTYNSPLHFKPPGKQ
jgi:hypothetical protein